MNQPTPQQVVSSGRRPSENTGGIRSISVVVGASSAELLKAFSSMMHELQQALCGGGTDSCIGELAKEFLFMVTPTNRVGLQAILRILRAAVFSYGGRTRIRVLANEESIGRSKAAEPELAHELESPCEEFTPDRMIRFFWKLYEARRMQTLPTDDHTRSQRFTMAAYELQKTFNNRVLDALIEIVESVFEPATRARLDEFAEDE